LYSPRGVGPGRTTGALLFYCYTDEVSEVIFALGVELNTGKVGPQPLRVEYIDAAVDFRDGTLDKGGSFFFDDAQETTVLVAYDAAIASGVGSNAGEHGQVGTCLSVSVQDGEQCLGAEKGRISVHDKHGAFMVSEERLCHEDGMARAELLGLESILYSERASWAIVVA